MPTKTLPKRPLGTSGMDITRVGFGAWAAGGGGWAYGWGPQDDRETIAAIRRAVDLGVNWIDTAAIYGLGHSEEVVGRALAAMPASDRPLVFTKCGLAADATKPMEEPARDLRPASIRKELEGSLKRLGVERIDLFQFHWPDGIGTPLEESWGVMAKLVEEGKARAIGVSNFDVPLLERCEAIRHVDSLQPPFSLVRRDAGEKLLPWCAAHRTGAIVYSPMQSGLMTDAFDAGRAAKMAPDDWRLRSEEFKAPALAKNLALRDSLKSISSRHGESVAAIAVAWTLAWPGVSGAIVGARSAKQVDGWIDAATLELTRSDLDDIASAIRKTGAGKGPARPPK